MALINCSNCGAQISDKSKNCIHCGVSTSISLKTLISCLECGALIEKTVSKCPECGFPLVVEKAKAQCPECSTMVEKDTNECPECGFPMSEFKSNNNQEDLKPVTQSSFNSGTKIGVFILSIVCGVFVLFFKLGMFSNESSEYDYIPTNINSSTTEQYYNYDTDEDKESDRDREERNRQNDLTMKLLNVENELRETVDELAELYRERGGNTGLSGVALKQRIVILYQRAVEIARATGDESLVREYERRKEKSISAMQMMN